VVFWLYFFFLEKRDVGGGEIDTFFFFISKREKRFNRRVFRERAEEQD